MSEARNKARPGEARLGGARHGKAWARNLAGHGSAWQGQAGLGEARNKVWYGTAGQGAAGREYGKVQGRTHKIRGGNKLWRDTK